jgi:leader peptidase (prepilin peptidase)/N-methyltransferase
MVSTFVVYSIIIYLLAGLSLLAWIDYKTGYLPDHILLALGVGGMIVLVSGPPTSLSYSDAMLGAVINGISFWGLRYTLTKATRREAMGLGDVKLVIIGGIWLGPWALPYIMGVSALATLLCLAITNLVVGNTNWRAEIPLGPGLSLAIFSGYLIQAFRITDALGPSAFILKVYPIL